jgi:nucleoside-diphosphate-sugar epimerase
MKTVLVAGGAGYIGSVLTELLLDAGHRVRVLDRLFFGRELLAPLEKRDGLTIIREDIRYAKIDAFDGVDVVMDLAGISNDPSADLAPSITEDINLGGATHIATLAKQAGVSRYVYSSSCSVYGHNGAEAEGNGNGHGASHGSGAGSGRGEGGLMTSVQTAVKTANGHRLTEDSPKAPVSHYARTKIAAEAELLKLHDEAFTVVLLRNATVYGLSYRMRFDLVINLMTLYAYKSRKLYVMGGGNQWRPLVHVRDVARAFLHVMEAPRELVAGQAFNVGSNEQNFQVYQIAQMIRDVVPHTELEVVPDDPDKRSYDVSFDRIEQTLGFRTEKSPYEGIVEVKQALERGRVNDAIQTKTVNYYKYLLDAEKLLQEVSYNGKIF